MKERAWPSWLALTIGVGVAAYAIVAQNPPVAEPIDAYPTVFSAIRAMKHVEAIAREPHPTGSKDRKAIMLCAHYDVDDPGGSVPGGDLAVARADRGLEAVRLSRLRLRFERIPGLIEI